VARVALLPAAATAFVAAGIVLWLSGEPRWAHGAWLVGLIGTGSPVVRRTLVHALRGHFATDIVATLAIVTAAILQEPLAGLIVVLMQTGGEALERRAEGRASRALRALEEEAPRIAHRLREGSTEDIAVDEIRVGDELLIRPGEMIPCDGDVIAGRSMIDSSRLTGEPMPLTALAGTRLLSGMLNRDGSLTLRAGALAAESQYARIVELVRSAEASKAPLQRMADRYAVWFTPATLVVCVVSWLVSGDPTRALAVLVVATPCPLILAAPVAIIGGINRAASRQIIVRNGGAFEQLDGITTAVLDKTGTLTIGEPGVSQVLPQSSFDADTVLRLAGALEQHSGHLLARPVVRAAMEHGGDLPIPSDVEETPGRGVRGVVEGRHVAVGGRDYLSMLGVALPDDVRRSQGLRAYVSVDGRLAGIVVYDDRLRSGVAAMLRRLRLLGVRRTLLLSGDDSANVREIAQAVGIEEAYGDLMPGDKAARVQALRANGERVLMLGDGTNDAPALEVANVGIALAGHGGGITAEAADAVILIDDLTRVAEAVEISRRTMRIARQSIWVGLGLSGTAMLFAAAGMIPPVAGALLQEGIDVAVILNALRSSVPSRAPHHR
jgi:heavy metal translocating P-type ATPase